MKENRILGEIQFLFSRGKSPQEIYSLLIKKGYPANIVKTNLDFFLANLNKKIPLRKIPTNKKSLLKNESKDKKSKSKIIIVSSLVVLFLILGIIAFFIFKDSIISEKQLESGKEVTLAKDKKIEFKLNEKTHNIFLNSISSNIAELALQSNPQTFEIGLNEVKKFDLSNNGFFDISIRLKQTLKDEVIIFIKKINEQKCSPTWNCTDWSFCFSSIQERTCIDENNCNDNSSKPKELQECTNQGPINCGESHINWDDFNYGGEDSSSQDKTELLYLTTKEERCLGRALFENCTEAKMKYFFEGNDSSPFFGLLPSISEVKIYKVNSICFAEEINTFNYENGSQNQKTEKISLQKALINWTDEISLEKNLTEEEKYASLMVALNIFTDIYYSLHMMSLEQFYSAPCFHSDGFCFNPTCSIEEDNDCNSTNIEIMEGIIQEMIEKDICVDDDLLCPQEYCTKQTDNDCFNKEVIKD